MGPGPEGVPALPQVGLRVLPTRTIYEFEGPEAHITLTFLTPALLETKRPSWRSSSTWVRSAPRSCRAT